MAKPHTDSGLAMVATTKLGDDAIAELAAQAAHAARTGPGWKTTGATVRIDHVNPGGLSLSVRGLGGSPAQLAFVLEAATNGEDGLTALRTRITSYRTICDTIYGIIPTGPRRMAGLPNYQKFLTAFCGSLRAADPAAMIVPDVRTGDLACEKATLSTLWWHLDCPPRTKARLFILMLNCNASHVNISSLGLVQPTLGSTERTAVGMY
jgi:hypothetical protein